MKNILALILIPVLALGCLRELPADPVLKDVPPSNIKIEKYIIDNTSELWACTIRNNTDQPLLVCAALKRWDNKQVIVGEREILPGAARSFSGSFIAAAPDFEWMAEITAFVVTEPLKKEEVKTKLFAKL